MEPILATCWTSFGFILDSILEPKTASGGDQKWDHFWNRPAPQLRGLALAFSGIIREVWKGYWNWNYSLQKKGRDYLNPPSPVGAPRGSLGRPEVLAMCALQFATQNEQKTIDNTSLNYDLESRLIAVDKLLDSHLDNNVL